MTTVMWFEADWRPMGDVEVGDLIHPDKANSARRLQVIEVVRVERVRRATKGIIEVDLADGSTAWAPPSMKFWISRPTTKEP